MDLWVPVTLVAMVSQQVPMDLGELNNLQASKADKAVVSMRTGCLLSYVRYSLAG